MAVTSDEPLEHAGSPNESAAHAVAHDGGTARPALAIDEGVRRWYESCRCCLSDAYPEAVKQLDAERDAAKAGIAGPGICETAEAATPDPR